MRLTRVYVNTVLRPGTVVDLPTETASHLAKVLRARSGDEVVLFSGDGREFAGVIDDVRGARVSAAVGNGRDFDRESALAVTLIQCIPRGDRMDFIVQKATELGVARIVPILSQRSIVRLDEDQALSKLAHWQGVAVNACEQCGRNRLPMIETPSALLDYLGRNPSENGTRLVMDPDTEIPRRAAVAGAVDIAVGPEGGFAAQELDAFRVSGFVRIRLGPRILRTETAAIAALAWLQARYGDLQPNP